MKLLFTFLLLGALSPATASAADIYNCNGTWTSKPCGKQQPAKLTHGRFSRAKTTDMPAQETDARAALVAPAAEAGCEPTAGGADIRFSTVALTDSQVNGEHQLTATVTAANRSDKPVQSPIVVRVDQLDRRATPQRFQLADNLFANSSARRAFALGTAAAGQPSRFQLSLEYAPASFCDTRVVSSSEAVLSTTTSNTSNTSSRALSQRQLASSLSKDLDAIGKEVADAERRLRLVDASILNGPVAAESLRLEAEIAGACHKADLLDDEAPVLERCTDLRNRAAHLGSR